MGFSRENIRRIREDFSGRRLAAAEESREKKEHLYAEIPELEELDRQISSVGVRTMGAALTGGDTEAEIRNMRAEHTALRARRAALLREHGYPADYTDIHYRCEECLDTGFIGTKMCACMRRELILAGYESSGLGALLQTQSFESFSLDYYGPSERNQMQRNYSTLRDFAEHFAQHRSKSWLLIGATGLGKTHLSTAVARTVIDGGFDVVYETAQGMFAAFEAERFGRGDASENDAERYLSCDLLILDDLGTELTNTFTVSCLYNVINSRVSRGLSTIINTNLTYGELRARYADRITSRLFGEFRPLTFVGCDIRTQKLTRNNS